MLFAWRGCTVISARAARTFKPRFGGPIVENSEHGRVSATRYTPAASGPSSVELWWKLAVDGEHAVQHRVIFAIERSCKRVTAEHG
jgi:hypothetical protein